MKTRAAPPVDILAGREASPLVRAALEAMQLKHLYRQGWLRAGVPEGQCESVAEHTFGVALLAVLLGAEARAGIDPLKLLRMAVLHDVGECRAGDVTPHDGVSREAKQAREREGAERVLAGLPGGAEMLALWEEYERGEAPEARLVRQLDRLEMALQALVYEQQRGLDLGQFYASVRKVLEDPELVGLLGEIEAARPDVTHRG